MADCNCPDPIEVSNDCESCSVECPVTLNSECVTYNGVELPNLNIDPAQGINDIFVAIDNALEAEIFEDVITVTSAQIKLLFSTPKTLIVAPGSGKFLSILNVQFKLESGGTTPYTVAGVNLRFRFLNAANPLLILSDAALTSTNSNIPSYPIPSTTGTGFDNSRINDPFVLDTTSSNPSTGDFTAKIYLKYMITTV